MSSQSFVRNIYRFLVSTHTMAFLFVIYALAMAAATFVENDFGTETARKLIYEAWWFELIMLLGVINLTGNIIRFKLYRKEKWHSLVFHSAFVLILFGAFITRYIGYEGQMPIIEGETTNILLSERNYLMLRIDDGKKQKNPIYKRLQLSKLGKNKLHFATEFQITPDSVVPVEVELIEFVPNAKKVFEPGPSGKKYLELVESVTGVRKSRFVEDGNGLLLNGIYVSYNDTLRGGVNIFEDEEGVLKIKTNIPGRYQVMKTGETGILLRDSIYDFKTGALYEFDMIGFVVPRHPERGKVFYTPGNADENPWHLVRFNVKAGDKETVVDLTGGQYYEGNPYIFRLNDLNFVMFYGPKRIELPFSIKLRDFQIEYYPGSQSPKSYASEITVLDRDTTFDYRIYMNHVLDHKGYRFFQASYSITPDYERTILSVNHDFWGTWVTYIGYGLLYFGLIMIFFVKGSHFNLLRRRLNEVQEKKKTLGLIIALMAGMQSFAQQDSIPHRPVGDLNDPEVFTENILPSVAPDSIARKFGRLIIQDLDGRMEPVNTYSSALLRKLSKHDTYKLPGSDTVITADQAMLSMIILPHIWAYAPVIFLEKGDDKLREILGLPKEIKYAKLADFFDEKGNYILMPYVDEASKAKIKSKFQKDIQNVDRRVNLLYITLTGRTLRLFPKENDPNHRWYAPVEIPDAGFDDDDALFAGNVFKLVANSILKKDYASASAFLDAIADYQQKFGSAVLPSPEKVKWELFYNKYDAFRSMFWKLMLISLILLALSIAYVIKQSKWMLVTITAIKWIIGIMFLWMVFFLGLRWYISGRAPWSNAYESLIYVALATLLFGLIFGRRSHLTAAGAAFVSSVILMVAHWSWMDPEIANLVPVLNSYWLMIHVSIIVASYGPFVLSAILGFLALLFMIFTTRNNKLRFELTVKELTYINKMSMIVGLVLLTIGNFLGGQWANESWGRYWGWDPKETWALISIMVYALIVHEHIIPPLRGLFKLNVMSMFAIWSIIMTYFGVNFYLSGLHSYAKGDPVQTPIGVYVGLAVMIAVTVLAYFRYKKHYGR